MLFDQLPEFPPSLPDDELRLLAQLPDWGTVTEVDEADYPAARRLAKRGLIKIRREKDDPIALMPTWYAGRLPASRITA